MLKKLLKELKRAEEISNAADATWDYDPENEALEEEFDRAYKAEWKAAEKLVDAIHQATEIDKPTVRMMLMHQREKIEAIIAMEPEVA
jgi:hypothetical protein